MLTSEITKKDIRDEVKKVSRLYQNNEISKELFQMILASYLSLELSKVAEKKLAKKNSRLLSELYKKFS